MALLASMIRPEILSLALAACAGALALVSVWRARRWRRRWQASPARAGADAASRVMEARLYMALAESDRMRMELETIFDTVQDAMAVFGPDGRRLYANAVFKKLFGVDKPTDLGWMKTIQVTTLDGVPMPVEQIPHMRVLRGETAVPPMTLRVRRPQRPPLILTSHAAPLYSASGEMLGVLTSIRDVTTEMRHARNNEILRAVARACASAAEEVTVAEAALAELMAGLGCTCGAVIVRDPARPGHARGLALHLDPAIPATVQSRWRMLINNAPINSHAPALLLRVIHTGQEYFDRVTLPGTTQADNIWVYACTVPLRLDGAVFGVLAVGFAPQAIQDMREIDRELIRAAADEIATALHRARLYEEARQLALIDPLTGLRNHRALQDLLRHELTLGAAQSLPVSIIMLDLDHFHRFNEIFGHDAGDRALRAVAKTTLALLRSGDSAARYGGEEFIIVLPATDATHAGAIAERLRVAIARTPAFVDGTGQPVHLTVSLGHATFPVHASAPASLLKAADLALYAAKRAGRHTIVAYNPAMIEESGQFLPGASAFGAQDAGEMTLPSGADIETVQALITAIDLRDGYTAAHSEGVSRYAVAIATEMNLPAEYVEVLRLGGLVHDVGKIGVPDHILRKPGKLDDAEWRQMQAHATMGEEILRPVEQLRHLLPLVRWHHERLDGSGYPDGLRGDEIPLLVRILSVADVFEAFTAERPYHPGRPAVEGLRLLQREAAEGRMDAYIIEVFEAILLSQGVIEDTCTVGEFDLRVAA
jgi:diguanylate cyclase (GGDEF)-like protein/PAS domain S-box-containing protein